MNDSSTAPGESGMLDEILASTLSTKGTVPSAMQADAFERPSAYGGWPCATSGTSARL